MVATISCFYLRWFYVLLDSLEEEGMGLLVSKLILVLVNEGTMCLSIGPCCEWQHRAEVLNVKGARFCLMKCDPDLHDNVLGISLTI